MLYGKVPRLIDIDSLVNSVNGNKTKKEFIRNGIVYLISRIHNQQIQDKYDNYVLLNYKTLERIIGKGKGDRVGMIKDILVRNNIIEVDGVYQTNFKSLGYKIKKDFLSEDVVNYPYGERISKLIQDTLVTNYEFDEHQIELTESDKYSYLGEQFEKHILTWDRNVYDDLKSIGHEILESYKKKRSLKEKYIISLLNYIGLLIKYINDIENRNYMGGISPSNNRFNSILTSLPKSLRTYLKLNGSDLIEIDISSSQVYLLSCILNERFENEEEEGFNLKTLYPTLKTYFKISENVTEGVGLNNHRFFGCLFYKEDLRSIEDFCSFDFTEDFYEQIVEYGRDYNLRTTRSRVKDSIMNFLFNQSEEQRENSSVILILENRYKGLMSFFEGFFGSYKPTRLSILLQRVESHLILDKVVPKILGFNKNIPVFTIHDCIMTQTQYGQDVHTIMKDTIQSITNKPLNIKVKTLTPDREILKNKIVENCKIKKVKEGKTILIRKLKTNVIRGYNFLFPEGNNEINQIINNRYPH